MPRPYIWTYLYLDSGQVISSTSCEWFPGGKWEWIARNYADACECMPDEVGCEETEDGEVITVRGKQVGHVVNELRGVSVKPYAEAAE